MTTFDFPKAARVAAVNAVLACVAMVYATFAIYSIMNPDRILAILEAHPLVALVYVPFIILYPFSAIVINDVVSKNEA